MTQLEKVKTREALSMYDNLWDQSAIIQQMRAASKQEGAVETLQRTTVDIVQIRFPSLLDITRKAVHAINDTEKLHQLQIQLLTASNEENARALFDVKQDD